MTSAFDADPQHRRHLRTVTAGAPTRRLILAPALAGGRPLAECCHDRRDRAGHRTERWWRPDLRRLVEVLAGADEQHLRRPQPAIRVGRGRHLGASLGAPGAQWRWPPDRRDRTLLRRNSRDGECLRPRAPSCPGGAPRLIQGVWLPDAERATLVTAVWVTAPLVIMLWRTAR